jgi:RNA polymerase sigma-70 factor, ECF subfamily
VDFLTDRAQERHCPTKMTGPDPTTFAGEPPSGPSSVDSAVPGTVPSFASIYNDYFNFVWGCTRRLGVSAEAMDDVVQEVFIVIHARQASLERPEALRSWIYGIVRRTVSTHHRARRVRESRDPHELSLHDRHATQQPSPLDLAVQTDEVRLLSSLLEELDEAKREVFVLAELDEMTVPEIAEVVGIPVNTAYSRLRAARREFDEGLARRAARREPGGRLCRT